VVKICVGTHTIDMGLTVYTRRMYNNILVIIKQIIQLMFSEIMKNSLVCIVSDVTMRTEW